MNNTPTAPIGFILTFVTGFTGLVGYPLDILRSQVVRSIDAVEVDPDNGDWRLDVTDFVGCRHYVYLEWLTAVRPAKVDVVGNII